MLCSIYLSTYEKAIDATKAMRDLRDIKWKPNENDKMLTRQMDDAFSFYGSVVYPQEDINMYVDWLTLHLNCMVQRYRDTHKLCMNMEEILHLSGNGTLLENVWKVISRYLYQELRL